MWDILLKTWDYDPLCRIHLLSLASILIQFKTFESNTLSLNKSFTESNRPPIYETNKATTPTYNIPMKIYIKTLYRKTFTFYIDANDQIIDIKDMIENKEGHLVEKQRLFTVDGMELEDNKTLRDYYIKTESTLFLILRVRT